MHPIQQFCTLQLFTRSEKRHGRLQRFHRSISVTQGGLPVRQRENGLAGAFEGDHMAQFLERLIGVVPSTIEQLVAGRSSAHIDRPRGRIGAGCCALVITIAGG